MEFTANDLARYHDKMVSYLRYACRLTKFDYAQDVAQTAYVMLLNYPYPYTDDRIKDYLYRRIARQAVWKFFKSRRKQYALTMDKTLFLPSDEEYDHTDGNMEDRMILEIDLEKHLDKYPLYEYAFNRKNSEKHLAVFQEDYIEYDCAACGKANFRYKSDFVNSKAGSKHYCNKECSRVAINRKAKAV